MYSECIGVSRRKKNNYNLITSTLHSLHLYCLLLLYYFLYFYEFSFPKIYDEE